MMNYSKQRLGIYAGSFAPFHVGHLDIVKQAAEVFDGVLVAQGINPQKRTAGGDIVKYPLPTKFFADMFRNRVQTIVFSSLLTYLIETKEQDYDVTLVRGLRSGADLEYEQNMVAFLRGMYSKIKVVAFYCDPKFRHVSSSGLRAIAEFSESEYKKYVVA